MTSHYLVRWMPGPCTEAGPSREFSLISLDDIKDDYRYALETGRITMATYRFSTGANTGSMHRLCKILSSGEKNELETEMLSVMGGESGRSSGQPSGQTSGQDFDQGSGADEITCILKVEEIDEMTEMNVEQTIPPKSSSPVKYPSWEVQKELTALLDENHQIQRENKLLRKKLAKAVDVMDLRNILETTIVNIKQKQITELERNVGQVIDISESHPQTVADITDEIFDLETLTSELTQDLPPVPVSPVSIPTSPISRPATSRQNRPTSTSYQQSRPAQPVNTAHQQSKSVSPRNTTFQQQPKPTTQQQPQSRSMPVQQQQARPTQVQQQARPTKVQQQQARPSQIQQQQSRLTQMEQQQQRPIQQQQLRPPAVQQQPRTMQVQQHQRPGQQQQQQPRPTPAQQQQQVTQALVHHQQIMSQAAVQQQQQRLMPPVSAHQQQQHQQQMTSMESDDPYIVSVHSLAEPVHPPGQMLPSGTDQPGPSGTPAMRTYIPRVSHGAIGTQRFGIKRLQSSGKHRQIRRPQWQSNYVTGGLQQVQRVGGGQELNPSADDVIDLPSTSQGTSHLMSEQRSMTPGDSDDSDKLVELVPGMGVKVCRKQLRVAQRTKRFSQYTRNLMMLVFTMKELSVCSVTGFKARGMGRENAVDRPALDQTRVQALIVAVQQQFPSVAEQKVKRVMNLKILYIRKSLKIGSSGL